MSLRALIIGAVVLLLGAGAVFGYLAMGAESQPAADGAAAKAAPVPAEAEPPAANKNPSHVRLSNVKLLHPPEKKDFAKVDAPEKNKPADEEESD